MVLLGRMKKTEAAAELEMNYDAYCKSLHRKNLSFQIIATKAGHCWFNTPAVMGGHKSILLIKSPLADRFRPASHYSCLGHIRLPVKQPLLHHLIELTQQDIIGPVRADLGHFISTLSDTRPFSLDQSPKRGRRFRNGKTPLRNIFSTRMEKQL